MGFRTGSSMQTISSSSSSSSLNNNASVMEMEEGSGCSRRRGGGSGNGNGRDGTIDISVELSEGEQQRLAFARILFWRPQWAFMDETTSHVDPAMEKKMWRCLMADVDPLPVCGGVGGGRTTVVAVSHRNLDGFERVVNLEQFSIPN
jgi:ABC-type glutathione transport system ATPase component